MVIEKNKFIILLLCFRDYPGVIFDFDSSSEDEGMSQSSQKLISYINEETESDEEDSES